MARRASQRCVIRRAFEGADAPRPRRRASQGSPSACADNLRGNRLGATPGPSARSGRHGCQRVQPPRGSTPRPASTALRPRADRVTGPHQASPAARFTKSRALPCRATVQNVNSLTGRCSKLYTSRGAHGQTATTIDNRRDKGRHRGGKDNLAVALRRMVNGYHPTEHNTGR
jgi:hypothetical protein